MECPRCGGDLDTYSMWGRETHACSQCNYVGVPVEHQSDRDKPESWSDAISRFYEKHAETTEEVDVDSVDDDLSEIPGIDDDADSEVDDPGTDDPDADTTAAGTDSEDVEDADPSESDVEESESEENDPSESDVEESEREDGGASKAKSETDPDAQSEADDEDETTPEDSEADDDESEVVADGGVGAAGSTRSSGPDRYRKHRKRR